MDATALLADHAAKPRHLGKLPDANAVGDAGSIVVGDALRFHLRIEGAPDAAAEEQRIVGAGFQVFNCRGMIASASVLAELVQGRSVAEARLIDAPAIAEALGGLDPYQLPPQIWGVTALHAAIAAYRGEELPVMEAGPALVCRCLGISEDHLRRAVLEDGVEEAAILSEITGAGTGCGTCRADIRRLIEEWTGSRASASASAAAPAPTTPLQVVNRIRVVVDERLRPDWDEEAGGFDLWDYTGARVVVRALGCYRDDSERCERERARLERLLRDEVDPTLSVVVAEADKG